eukprot:gene28240-31341_t
MKTTEGTHVNKTRHMMATTSKLFAGLEEELGLNAKDKDLKWLYLTEDQRDTMFAYKLAEAEQFLETCVAQLIGVGSKDFTAMYKVARQRCPPAMKFEYRINRDRVITMDLGLHDLARNLHTNWPEFTLTYPEYDPKAKWEQDRVITMDLGLHDLARNLHTNWPEFTLMCPEYDPKAKWEQDRVITMDLGLHDLARNLHTNWPEFTLTCPEYDPKAKWEQPEFTLTYPEYDPKAKWEQPEFTLTYPEYDPKAKWEQPEFTLTYPEYDPKAKDRVITMDLGLHDLARNLHTNWPEFTLTYPEYNPKAKWEQALDCADTRPASRAAKAKKSEAAQDALDRADTRPASRAAKAKKSAAAQDVWALVNGTCNSSDDEGSHVSNSSSDRSREKNKPEDPEGAVVVEESPPTPPQGTVTSRPGSVPYELPKFDIPLPKS